MSYETASELQEDPMDFQEHLAETDPGRAADEAEQSCLGAQLLFPALVGSDWLPSPYDYWSADHSAIAAAIVACSKAGAVDIITVFDHLQAIGKAAECGGLSYLRSLAESVPSNAATKAHAEIVKRKALDRRQTAIRAQAAALLKGPSDLATVLPEIQAILGSLDAARPEQLRPTAQLLDFGRLSTVKAPPKIWRRENWVPANGTTVVAGKGGEGKSSLIQHEATCGSLGRSYFAPESAPYRSLVWNCEDEHDDLWRKQEQICEHEQIDMASLQDRLYLLSRYGCENALMAETSRGALVTTGLMKELRQQVNDLQIDTLWLDNAAHLFLGDHDNRTQVTQFINALNGLVTGRAFSVMITTHVSRAQGSEYSGSVAWENAARMRWYLGSRLPDQGGEAAEDAQPGSEVRYLCKRKSNYSARDYVRFTMRGGLLVPDESTSGHVAGIVSALDEKRAEEVCLAGFKSLCAMGIRTTDGKTSPDYLPSQMVAKGLAQAYTKGEIGRAMNRLMTRGVFARAPVGQHANRSPKFGLVLQEGQP